jgi:hypothetical protein
MPRNCAASSTEEMLGGAFRPTFSQARLFLGTEARAGIANLWACLRRPGQRGTQSGPLSTSPLCVPFSTPWPWLDLGELGAGWGCCQAGAAEALRLRSEKARRAALCVHVCALCRLSGSRSVRPALRLCSRLSASRPRCPLSAVLSLPRGFACLLSLRLRPGSSPPALPATCYRRRLPAAGGGTALPRCLSRYLS